MYRPLFNSSLVLAALTLAPSLASASNPTNWIERDGLRFAGRIDAGSVRTGVEVEAALVLQNVSDRPLWVERLSPTCGCTVVEWSAAFLLPGETRQAPVRLDAYDIAGHHRHTVFIVGAGDQTLGSVIVTADAVREPEAGADLLVPVEFLDAGVHRPGESAVSSAPVRNLGDHPIQVDWRWKRGADVFAESSTATIVAPGSSTTLRLDIQPSSDLWGSKVEIRDEFGSVVLPVRGHWQDPEENTETRQGPLVLSNVATRDGNLVVDLGSLALGERRTRTIRITNHGAEPVRFLRAFTSANHDLSLSCQPAMLQPGATTQIAIEHLGVRLPGSFRAIVHLLFEGAPALSLHCRGFVRSGEPEIESPYLDTVVLEFDRRDPTSVTVRDGVGAELLAATALDHRGYARAIAGTSKAPARLCSNCGGAEALELLPEIRVRRDGLQLLLLSVLGDEHIDPADASVLPFVADPNGTVIQALHPEHSHTQDAGAVPIVLFQDAFPLVEEAARRTRVSAVYVVAESDGTEARVLPLRDVLVLDPGSVDATSGPIRLRLHVSAHQILDWELLVPDRS